MGGGKCDYCLIISFIWLVFGLCFSALLDRFFFEKQTLSLIGIFPWSGCRGCSKKAYRQGDEGGWFLDFRRGVGVGIVLLLADASHPRSVKS